MQQQQILPTAYRNQVVEACLLNLDTELSDHCTIQAKHDAAKETPLNETVFVITILEYVQSKVQQAGDVIHQTMLVASNVVRVNEFEAEAKKQCQRKRAEISSTEQRIAVLEREKVTLAANTPNMKHRRWVSYVSLFAGLADAALAYSALRQTNSFIFALFAALTIFGVISTSSLFLVAWVKHSKKQSYQRIKTGVILIASFLFFYAIATFRANGFNSDIDITIDHSETLMQPTHLSPWPICLVSYTIFATMFFASLFFWQEQAERKKQEAYQALCKDINKHKQEVQALVKQVEETEAETTRQKDLVRAAFDYTQKAIMQAKHIGCRAIILYKKTYTDFNGSAPPFFSDTHTLSYDEEPSFFNTQNQSL